MVDINEWRLEYPGCDVLFGTHESGHPFTRQVIVGPVNLETGDTNHPLSDGLVMGVDQLRGRTLGFSGAHHLPTRTPKHYRHERPMDLGTALESAWRGDWLRGKAGRVASLTNTDRGRVVYGRPRNYATDLDKARHGWVTWAADFATVDSRFYGADELVVSVGMAAGPVGGFTVPFTVPWGSVGVSASSRGMIVNTGTLPTWGVVSVAGPIIRPVVELLDEAGGVLWSMRAETTLSPGEVLEVDCRPWVRTVTRDGTDANGILRGATAQKAAIPVGVSEVKLSGVDATGTAGVTVRYRPAFGGL